MARAASVELPEPMFHEPVFDEGKVSADPTGFLQNHPGDAQLYKQIEKLLTTEVVGFQKSRVDPDALYTLAEAFGPGRGYLEGNHEGRTDRLSRDRRLRGDHGWQAIWR
jgi:hypothetical protein